MTTSIIARGSNPRIRELGFQPIEYQGSDYHGLFTPFAAWPVAILSAAVRMRLKHILTKWQRTPKQFLLSYPSVDSLKPSWLLGRPS